MTEEARAVSPPLPPDPYQQAEQPMTPSQDPSQGPLSPSPAGQRPGSQSQSQLSNASKRSRNDSRHSLEGTPSSRTRPVSMSEVVTDAFQQSPATQQVNPDIITLISAQVTEQVMRNLAQQQTNVLPSQPPVTPLAQPTAQMYYPPPPRSPTQDSVDSRQDIFTPPLPDLELGNQDERPPFSPPLERQLSDSDSQFSQRSRGSARSGRSIRTDEMPRATKTNSSSTVRPNDLDDALGAPDQRPSEPEKAPQARTRDRTDSKTSQATLDGSSRSPVESQTVDVETPLEKIWKPLFTNGRPMKRLGQFLQGLALHLIEQYEPQRSLVVTPQKMLRFLKEAQVDEDYYPWDVIFGGKMGFQSISAMYCKLSCEHHYVQTHARQHPIVPGLTPFGFEVFMTFLIQAHPEVEYERLAKAVMNMPISNADDKAERFPKELPRRLLPAESNLQAARRLFASLDHEPHVLKEVKLVPAMFPPPTSAPPVQKPSQKSFSERERQPYASSSNVVDDDDLGSTSVPIERERKPYTAREGTGKVYTADESRAPPNPPRTAQAGTHPTRRNSGLSSSAAFPQNGGRSEPVNIPQRNPNPKRMSAGYPNPPLPSPGMNGGFPPKPTRGRSSPPPPSSFLRPGNDMSGSIPNQPFGSPLHPVQSTPVIGEHDEEVYRRFQNRPRGDRSSNSGVTSDDMSGARGFPIPNRNPPSANTYGEYGSLGGPVGGPPPIGSSYPSNRSVPPPSNPPHDDRRRNVFGGPGGGQGGGDGGTDGYGSYASGVNGGYSQPPQQPYGSSQH